MGTQISKLDSVIDAATVAAYRHADYQVHGSPSFTLKVEQRCRELLAAHHQLAVDCSAYLTACNPFSQQLAAADNAARMDELAANLTALGLPYWPGVGIDPDGLWPGEVSFLVFGVGLDAACELGRRFQQNAILWAGTDAVPRLCLLR